MAVVAVVTGAASGIGRATALALGARGLTVICADVDEERAGEVGVPYRVDVSDAPAMERFAEWVRAEHGAPAVLVNNAGIGIGGSFFDHTVADWRRIVDVNLMGVVHGCLFFGPQLLERGRGHIVNVASAAAYTPTRTLPAYGATKAGVLMLTESLRAELSGTGVGVSAVCPGFIATGIYRASRYAGVDPAEGTRRGELAERLAGRWAPGPETVARAIVRAIEHDRPLVPVTAGAWGAYALARLSPAAMRRLARLGGDDPFLLVERFAGRFFRKNT
ncbi:SDR family NAD(P)-dependent oxidoreductase [Actinoallomurus sp. CA-142502]|uniref:SDR family NAD(P)-dependent oxidoreductase n=1 Tax=Actinoallomurus sp. CA-142502 TaxID=3239885 RepID=UPI003D8F3BBA